jgi:broad specificity phosphatase PhoE
VAVDRTDSETIVYLVRHGETDHNRAGIFQGTNDIPLNATGCAQAMALARTLDGVHFDAVYTSPLIRAQATARAIVAARSLDIAISHGLHELSYGNWQGVPALERDTADPGLVHRWRTAPWTVQFPNGETLADAHARVLSAFTAILERHPGQTVLITAHGHVNRLVLMHLLGLPRDAFWNVEQQNGSCYKIVVTNTGVHAYQLPVSTPHFEQKNLVHT